MTKQKRLVSGMQPTGSLHLGNYLGALQNWIQLTKQYDCVFFIADLHSITIPYETSEMQNRIFNAALDYLAGGLDPNHCTIFVQSHVPQHTELNWIFNCFAPLGELMRMTQFKQKTTQWEGNENGEEDNLPESERDGFLAQAGKVNAGLFTYPVLQSADILLYKAESVPVGADQVQHVELTREIAKRFNNRFGEVFPYCEAHLSSVPRLMGLDAVNKMSKSIGNHLALSLTQEEIAHKVTREAVSDSRRIRRTDPGVPEECNLFEWHKIFSSQEEQEWAHHGCKTAEIGCFHCKQKVAGNINTFLEPFRERHAELSKTPDFVWDVLQEGGKKARAIAQETMEEVKSNMGLLRK